jgi:hypothetical protein
VGTQQIQKKAAFGFKAHSGWAALVVLGTSGSDVTVLERRRVDLVDEEWAKQPYHAAEGAASNEARKVVKRGIDSSRRIALREMRSAIKRARNNGYEVVGCGLPVGEPMPEWTVDEILAVHFRMHKAEGVLFRDALSRAARACDLPLVEIPEKSFLVSALTALAVPANILSKRVAVLGKSVGPPWGRDQKDATVAAMVALESVHDVARPGS